MKCLLSFKQVAIMRNLEKFKVQDIIFDNVYLHLDRDSDHNHFFSVTEVKEKAKKEYKV